MARYWVGGTANWDNTAGNKWSDTSGGAGGFSVPTSADDVYFDANSGVKTITVTENVAAKSLTCTGFTGTLDGSSNLTVAGNVTFVAGMTITATGTLTITATATLTSGGKTWTGNLTTNTSGNTTFTLADAWVIDGSFTFGNSANTHTFNGFTLSIKTNLTISGSSIASGSDGTTEFIMIGTGNIVHSGSTATRKLQNPFRINTAGTITFDTHTITFDGDFVYVAGTVVTTGSLVHFNNGSGSAKTLTTNGITFNNVTFGNVGASTYTLSNVMDITGTLVFGASNSNTYTLNGSSISAKGDVTITITNGIIAGTTVLNINGTGSQTWSGTSSTPIRLDTNINKSSGTLTLGTNIAYNTGTLTYTAGTVDTTTNSSTLTIAASTTLNTNGITWNNVTFATVTGIYTLTTDFTVNGTFTQASGSNVTFNGADIYCNGNVVVYASSSSIIMGTTDFIFAGTGTWSGAQSFACNVTITGTYTLSGTVAIRGNCTFTCTTGTLITTGSTFEIPNNSAANVVINTNQTLNNFGSGTATITLSQALVITGTLAYLNNATITINGFSITIGGSLTLPTAALATGTTELILNGTGTWSGGTLRNPLTINTAGTITITGTVGYNTGTLTYTTGTVDASGSTLTIAASTTLNTNGITWNNVNISLGTVTNNSILTVNGLLTYTTYAVVLNGSDVILNGGFTSNSNSACTGTATIKFKNTGTWVHTSGGSISNNIVFDSGVNTITLGAIVRYATGTITYTSGVIDATTNNSTLSIHVSCTLNTNGMSWNNILIVGGSLTLNSLLTATGTLTLPNSNTTFSGTAGFTVGTLTNTTLTAARTYTLASTKTYTITGAFTSNTNTSTIRPTFRSSTGGSQAILTLNAGATQSLQFVNATDIDSSLGQQIYSYKGVLSNATNWFSTNGDFLVLAY